MLRKLIMLGALVVLAPTADAEGLRLPPVADKTTQAECSVCHMVFPPQFLPARSWQAILDNLGNHFGEDASLAEQDRKAIIAYLTAHAADSPATAGGTRLLHGIAGTATPLRITETPYWKRAHDEISPARFTSPQVKSAANCGACHRDAGRGVFAEPEEE